MRSNSEDGLYTRTDSPYWWASLSVPAGGRVRASTKCTDKKEAETVLARWKHEAHQQHVFGIEPSRLFDELMLSYLRETESKRSHDRDIYSAKHLYGEFTGRYLHSIGAKDVRRYIAKRRSSVSDATINREIGLLSAAINYAIREWEWKIDNPAAGRRLSEPEGRLRWLEHNESDALIVSAMQVNQGEHLADFITLALHTGCRSGELLGLEWKRVDLKSRLIMLEAQHTKSGKRRYIPINDTARDALLSRLRVRTECFPACPWVFSRGKGVRIRSVKKSFRAACNAAGITDFHIHDLRHTCAAWLVSSGVQLQVVRDLLGHSTIRMTERYAHLAPETIREALYSLDVSRLCHVAKNEKLHCN